eukprot:TRINITY_DN6945_c0_g1_i3.p1 TRINITY_DN6945_c0_g1~~TRINITY_DN6945_c0_g1_i3.p1  ORF type:complete len:487 (-),score=99.04 TRINITY_DN6945_c0_g1_i3:74-1534(-)
MKTASLINDSRESSKTDQNPEFQKNLKFINDMVGEEVGIDKIKFLLRGADGNVEIALNHLLNDLEREEAALIDRTATESPNPAERMDRILTDLAEEVKCPLCLGYFNQPVVLNCLHTFCMTCLESMVNEHSHIECPLCRGVSSLDETGIKGLKFNHYLANIVEKLKTAQNTRMCVECAKQLCTVYCKNCKTYLCNNCNDRLHSNLNTPHQRINYEDMFFSQTPKPNTTTSTTPIRSSVESQSDVVIPFNVKKEVCIDLWKTWLRSIWFAPSDFESNCVMTEFKASYIPYWLFEVEVNSNYRGFTGIHDRIRGRPEFDIQNRVLGNQKQVLSDIMICASDSIETELIRSIEPWKLDQIQRFTLKHSESIDVSPFSVSSVDAWTRVRYGLDQRMHRETEGILKKERPSEKISNLSVDSKYSLQKSRRLFVPVYQASCEYSGRIYKFIVNGATAKVYGQRPYSTTKLASLSFTGLGAAIGLLTSARLRG